MTDLFRKVSRISLALLLSGAVSACANLNPRAPSPVPLAANVDLERLSGDWYLIAHISTERDQAAHNAIEHYRLRADGNVAVTYTNRLGSFDGPAKKLTPVGYPVADSGNALWGMRFRIPGVGVLWPLQFEYRISHLEPDYSVMIVGRSKLDFVWLMARDHQMPESEFQRYRQMMANWGYDVSELVRVPQRWPDDGASSSPKP